MAFNLFGNVATAKHNFLAGATNQPERTVYGNSVVNLRSVAHPSKLDFSHYFNQVRNGAEPTYEMALSISEGLYHEFLRPAYTLAHWNMEKIWLVNVGGGILLADRNRGTLQSVADRANRIAANALAIANHAEYLGEKTFAELATLTHYLDWAGRNPNGHLSIQAQIRAGRHLEQEAASVAGAVGNHLHAIKVARNAIEVAMQNPDPYGIMAQQLGAQVDARVEEIRVAGVAIRDLLLQITLQQDYAAGSIFGYRDAPGGANTGNMWFTAARQIGAGIARVAEGGLENPNDVGNGGGNPYPGYVLPADFPNGHFAAQYGIAGADLAQAIHLKFVDEIVRTNHLMSHQGFTAVANAGVMDVPESLQLTADFAGANAGTVTTGYWRLFGMSVDAASQLAIMTQNGANAQQHLGGWNGAAPRATRAAPYIPILAANPANAIHADGRIYNGGLYGAWRALVSHAGLANHGGGPVTADVVDAVRLSTIDGVTFVTDFAVGPNDNDYSIERSVIADVFGLDAIAGNRPAFQANVAGIVPAATNVQGQAIWATNGVAVNQQHSAERYGLLWSTLGRTQYVLDKEPDFVNLLASNMMSTPAAIPAWLTSIYGHANADLAIAGVGAERFDQVTTEIFTSAGGAAVAWRANLALRSVIFNLEADHQQQLNDMLNQSAIVTPVVAAAGNPASRGLNGDGVNYGPALLTHGLSGIYGDAEYGGPVGYTRLVAEL